MSNFEELKPTSKALEVVLMKRRGMKQTEIAEELGLNDSQVSLLVSLHHANERLKSAVDSGDITISAVERLLPLSKTEQGELVDMARDKTVKEVVALVKAYKGTMDPKETLLVEELKSLNNRVRKFSIHELETIRSLEETLDQLEKFRATLGNLTDEAASKLVTKRMNK